MHKPSIPSSSPCVANTQGPSPFSAAELLRRQARLLHRASQSDKVSVALPALRRLLAAGVFPGERLTALYGHREHLRRKHFLRALAVEAGFADWERGRLALERLPVESIERFVSFGPGQSTLNAWFSNEAQARAYADEHGGRVVRFGTQAVVLE